MEMTWLARMEDIDAVPKIQPRAFHLCSVSFAFSQTTSQVGGKMPGRCGSDASNLPSCVKADDFTKPRSCCHTSPVVNTRRRRDSRSHLGNTSRYHEVTACDSNEFVNDTCRAAIVERDDLSVISMS